MAKSAVAFPRCRPPVLSSAEAAPGELGADVIAAVCRSVEEGVPLPEAYLCHGVSAAVGERWREERGDFAHELAMARARYVRSLIREIREAVAGSGARHDWRASEALLERVEKESGLTKDQAREEHFIFTPAQMAALQARRKKAEGRK